MDPVFREKLLAILQAQRNNAIDACAVAEARAALLSEENAALKTKLAQMGQREAASPAPVDAAGGAAAGKLL